MLCPRVLIVCYGSCGNVFGYTLREKIPGISIHYSEDGEEALFLIQRRDVQAAIIDAAVSFQKEKGLLKNGLELLERVYEDEGFPDRNLPILTFSSRGPKDSILADAYGVIVGRDKGSINNIAGIMRSCATAPVQ
ncbi:TPA: hypothetical protein DDW69_03510 [candidate division CPR2 bacterium]|uniref:Uncharacterized protein n=1 Tax=candidate division CPR2 bacterium GW2011_GWC1_41_48 TaxID=1618344 RepID=A0A0G0W7Q5_UNCC2|nr:MAG: hypothetical protein UT47_C0003G0105 [candidate division CPR2 bacterium GW2011_GWC2_39_35]KKR27781.1 MAG: hypothetical protein UT59_C0044G0008 [candidate division CPR2 bacterium GW2011_GWD1_39_7]KKR28798.1 MAG: hypothetical protein UT60_C0012G0006 [candidate division CPR2 bacterium GW2011_GWD2_39_7]KKS09044.1 MAG: hypothetical protein UU65_C0003G0099 [candidate division CPR2 bacterium GW2011_GWC1_41_48]OGB59799.1 MAG: hypothetical protein A2Y27_00035 [candidate division CPR2 bacterium G